MEDPNRLKKKSKDDGDGGEASSSQALITSKQEQIDLVKKGDKGRPILIGASIKKEPKDAKAQKSAEGKNKFGAIQAYNLGDEYKSDILYPEKYLQLDWSIDLNTGFIIGAVESGREVRLVTNYQYYVNMKAGVLNNAGFWELLCLKRCGYEFYKDTEGKIFAARRGDVKNNYRDIIEKTFNEYKTASTRLGELDSIYREKYADEASRLISSLSSAQARQNTERNQTGISATPSTTLAPPDLKEFQSLLEKISRIGLGKNPEEMSEDEQIRLAMTLSLRDQGFNLQDNRFTRNLGLGCQNVRGDGFCFFRAIAQQIVDRNLNDQRHSPLTPLPTTMEEILERVATYFSEHSQDLMERIFPPPRREDFGTGDRSEELYLAAQEAYNDTGERQRRLRAFRENFYEYINLGRYDTGGPLLNAADWLPQVMSDIFQVDIDIYDAQQPTGFRTDNRYGQRIGLGRVNNDHYISLNGDLETAWRLEQEARLPQSGNPSVSSATSSDASAHLRNPLILNEAKNELNLPAQSQIQRNAKEFGIPLEALNDAQPGDIRLPNGTKTQKTLQNSPKNGEIPAPVPSTSTSAAHPRKNAWVRPPNLGGQTSTSSATPVPSASTSTVPSRQNAWARPLNLEGQTSTTSPRMEKAVASSSSSATSTSGALVSQLPPTDRQRSFSVGTGKPLSGKTASPSLQQGQGSDRLPAAPPSTQQSSGQLNSSHAQTQPSAPIGHPQTPQSGSNGFPPTGDNGTGNSSKKKEDKKSKGFR